MISTKQLGVGLAAALLLLASGCTRHQHEELDVTDSAEPDKILFNKSIEDIENKRWTQARLQLQTLMGTYPDSVYLAKAKMALADSYFLEGTRSAMARGEIEYKDFITFFPTLPEAQRAQYQVAMIHYRQLELPDRDSTHAFRAEQEFQTYLKQYPDSELYRDAFNKLLEVQEVLAEGIFRIGRFYFVRRSPVASSSRLIESVERYPNYSQRDEALWMLYRIYSEPIPERGWGGDREMATDILLRIAREHPTSPHFEEARKALAQLEIPVPEPDPVILERAENLETVGEKAKRTSLLGRLFGRFSGRPDTSAAAARLGPPPLEPPADFPNDPIRMIVEARRKAQEASNTVTAQPAEGGRPNGTPPPRP